MADTRQPELSLARFEALVEIYGGDLDRFPEAERGAAKALVLHSKEARRALDAARALDALLESARVESTSLELEQRLAGIPAQHAQRVRLVFPFGSRKLGFLAAAAALALGVFSGSVREEADVRGLDRDEVALAFADELFQELDNVAFEEGEAP